MTLAEGPSPRPPEKPEGPPPAAKPQEYREMAEDIEKQLREAGLHISIDQTAWKLEIDPVRRKQAQDILRLLQSLGNADPRRANEQRSLLYRLLSDQYGQTVAETFQARARNARGLEERLTKMLDEGAGEDAFTVVYAPRLRAILAEIDMPSRERRSSVYVIYEGRPAISVGKIHEYLGELRNMRQNVPLPPAQLAFVQSVEQLLQQTIHADLRSEAEYQWSHQPRAYEKDLRQGKDIARFLGFLAASGIALLGAIADFRHGKPSLITLAAVGLAGGLGGFFRGKTAEQVDRLSFLTSRSFETLRRDFGIRGREWADVIETLQTNRGLVERFRRGRMTREDFVNELAASSSGARTSLARMSPQQLLELADMVRTAGNPELRGVVRRFIEGGAGPESIRNIAIPSV